MKRKSMFKHTHRLRSNAQRRIMLKRLHQKVLQRRKLFIQEEYSEQLSRAC